MKKLGIMLLAAAFAVCGLMTFAACNEETFGPGDDPIVTPGSDDPGKPEEPTPPEEEPEATEGLVFELLTMENVDDYDYDMAISAILGENFEDCYMCTRLTVVEENVVIPSTYNGLPVRMVRWYDLEPEIANGIISFYIPDSVQIIQWDEYDTFESLTEIRLPRNPNVMIYGSINLSGCAFYNDPNNWEDGALYMDDWLLATNGDLPEEYTVKQGTVGIAWGAFWYQDNEDDKSHVKKVTVPDGVRTVAGSFAGCFFLKEVVLPDSLSSIGYSAFMQCESLESITVPDSVTSIGYGAFWDCINLTNVIIPDGVTSIGKRAFELCVSLKSITIPDGVTSIGERAFMDCGRLTSITIPDGVTSIGESAFYNCVSLTSIVIPDGVTSIGDYAFFDCYSLTSITISDSVTYIGDLAFSGCESLNTVYYRGSEAEWNEIEIGEWNDELKDAEIVFNYKGE